jgi:hypothetical protein
VICLTDALRKQLEGWNMRYEMRLEEVASCADPGEMEPALKKLSDAASVCNQLAQLLCHREWKEKQQDASLSPAEAPS